MIFYKLMVFAGMLFIGMLGAVNSWADDAAQCKHLYDADKYDQAVPVCFKAANLGSASAQDILGFLYEYGKGVSKNQAEATKWYLQSAEQGYVEAQFTLGVNYNGDREYAKAIKWYRKAAEQGHSRAQQNLGEMYLYGRGVKRNYIEAKKWFLVTAQNSDVVAQFRLGQMYEEGLGVKKNQSEMLKWYRKSAEGDSDAAIFKLAVMYDKGLHVKKNPVEAVKWYRKEATAPNGVVVFNEAQFRLGEMYEIGLGVKQNYAEAIKWYRAAAHLWNANAMFKLGTMYDHGRIVNQNYAEAAKWYEKVPGNTKAKFRLAEMYYKGQGVVKDYTEAVKWYHKAAKQGIADAQFNLGVVYANGQGVLQSATAAADWYYKAGISYLNQGKREDALTSVERIKNLGNVSNAFLANKLLVRIYSGNKTAQVLPKRKKKESASMVSGTGWPTVGGYVVTNHHVVAGHQNIVLLRRDGKLIKASVAVDDAANDLVLLKPESMEYMPPSLPLADHPAIVGEKVFTIGYPHPDLMGAEPKLTQGIINARTGMRNDPRVFQISVPIQSGNSGGPLLNMRGEVVGITTSKISAVKIFKWTGDMPQNVNYAVKSSYIHILLSSASLSTKVSILPVKSAKLSDLAQRIEGSVLMIIAK